MPNTKISALTADTAPTADDLVVTVNDPGGTPATRKATVTNFTKAIPAVVGDSGSGGTKGLVPAPGAGDAAASKFLKADGTWAIPSGGAETGANSDITSMDGLTGALEFPTRVTFLEGAAPATPAANKVSIYAKADGLLYSKDDAGLETLVSGGGFSGSAAGGDLTGTYPNPTVAAAAITYVKMQDVSAASRILGRGSSGGSGDIQELQCGVGLSITGTTINADGSGGGGITIVGAALGLVEMIRGTNYQM